MWSAVLRCYGATVLRCYGAGGYVGNQKSAKKGGPLVEFGGAPSISAFFFFGVFFSFSGDINMLLFSATNLENRLFRRSPTE